jgi:hypothetical protein
MVSIRFFSFSLVFTFLLCGCGEKSSVSNNTAPTSITFRNIKFDEPGALRALQKLCLEEPSNSANSCSKQNPSRIAFNVAFGTLKAHTAEFQIHEDKLIGAHIFQRSDDGTFDLIQLLEEKYGKPIIDEGEPITLYTWYDSQSNYLIVLRDGRSVSIDFTSKLGSDLRNKNTQMERDAAKSKL